MNILLDTHIFLWWITDAPKISKTAYEFICDSNNTVYWSAVSSWEVSIKYALGRLPLPDVPEIFLASEIAQNRIESLPIFDVHAFRAGQLPLHHRDPFDRMIVAQAQVESLVLLTNDPRMSLYDVNVQW